MHPISRLARLALAIQVAQRQRGEDRGSGDRKSSRSTIQRFQSHISNESGPDWMYIDVSMGFSKLTHFDVLVDGKHWYVAAEKWRDCICPNLGVLSRNGDRPSDPLVKAVLSRAGDSLQISMYGGYGSERYKVVWQVTRSRVATRKIIDFNSISRQHPVEAPKNTVR